MKKIIILIGIGAFLSPLWGLGGYAQTHPKLGGGSGDTLSPYQITTPAQLKELADYINAGNGDSTKGVFYIVINDLDLTAYQAGDGWDPIGNNSVNNNTHRFQGKFNGNNKVVKNLKINRPTEHYQGLFGWTNKAKIENIGIENCDIVGDQCVGGLVGRNDNSTISNCYATGSVSGTYDVGGLVGVNSFFSPISNCYTTGNVSGNSSVGGLVGFSTDYSSISNCYATGNVSGTEAVGGLVGNNMSFISNCYATGNVYGSELVGGLVGYNAYSTIKNCVSANDSVVTTADITTINRIVGDDFGGTFQNNYALSSMKVINSSGIVSITSNLNTEAGMSKSMSDFQNFYFYTTAGNWKDSIWSINNPNGIWKICIGEGMLPFLRWQNILCYEPVTNITGVPTTATVGVPLTLTATVVPSDATNQSIVWSIKDIGTTGASIVTSPSLAMHTTATGTVTLTATITNGLTKTTNYTQDFIITVVPVPVDTIIGIPATATINQTLTLTGTVMPSNATNRTIEWSIINAGSTNASVKNNTFFASSEGVAFLSAKIENGKAIGVDYEQNFTITVSSVGINQLTMDNGQLTIYPNPTTGQLTINNEQLTIKNVEIFDVIGQKVNHQSSIVNCQLSIDISHLANGMYFLKVDNKMFKIIKN